MDKEVLLQQHNDVIAQLVEANDKSTLTKKDLVCKLIDVSRPLLEQNMVKGMKPYQLASYINQQLMVNKIDFPRNESFYSLFTESEKRGYGTNSNSMSSRIGHEHDWRGDEFEQVCECGDILRLGKHYTEAQDETQQTSKIAEASTKPKQDKTPKRPYSNPVVEYLQRLSFLNEDFADLLKDHVKKYHKYQNVAEALDEHFNKQDMDKLLLDVKSLEAQMIHAEKLADARQKVGEFEKIKAFILQLTTHTVAHVAKLISITPKHMTNNIIRNITKSEKMMRWFKTIFVTCPECKKDFGIELSDWFNEQCVRCDLDLEMNQPILRISK